VGLRSLKKNRRITQALWDEVEQLVLEVVHDVRGGFTVTLELVRVWAAFESWVCGALSGVRGACHVSGVVGVCQQPAAVSQCTLSAELHFNTPLTAPPQGCRARHGPRAAGLCQGHEIRGRPQRHAHVVAPDWQERR
jgi:hypothetical protein